MYEGLSPEEKQPSWARWSEEAAARPWTVGIEEEVLLADHGPVRLRLRAGQGLRPRPAVRRPSRPPGARGTVGQLAVVARQRLRLRLDPHADLLDVPSRRNRPALRQL